jgi:hypothetical protein
MATVRLASWFLPDTSVDISVRYSPATPDCGAVLSSKNHPSLTPMSGFFVQKEFRFKRRQSKLGLIIQRKSATFRGSDCSI